MPSPLQSLIRRATRDNSKPLNILTFPTHERYETGLARTGHRFYGWQGENIKTWNKTYAPIPENYHVLNGDLKDRQLPMWVNIDLVLSQNKFAQYPIARKLAGELGVPLVTLEHTLPAHNTPKSAFYNIMQMRGDLDIFISEYSIEKWGWRRDDPKVGVVRHGIDEELFSPDESVPREPIVCSVVNDWMNRDWCCGFKMWAATVGYPNPTVPVNVWGDTRGLSKAAPDVPSLVREYRRSRVFLNTSLISPVPTALLEAMACGCAVVSTNTCMIPEFIEHGVNGFMADNPEKLRDYVDMLLRDEALANKMGAAARKTIVEHFSLNKFVENWQEVLQRVL